MFPPTMILALPASAFILLATAPFFSWKGSPLRIILGSPPSSWWCRATTTRRFWFGPRSESGADDLFFFRFRFLQRFLNFSPDSALEDILFWGSALCFRLCLLVFVLLFLFVSIGTSQIVLSC